MATSSSYTSRESEVIQPIERFRYKIACWQLTAHQRTELCSTADNAMTGTALIVEDHPEQADLVARILSMRDIRSMVAENGESALRLAREYLPDVVLLDLMLPDINGFDVCRQLRTDRATMLIPIVMLTALNDAQHRVHGFRVGANAYVTKPYGVDDLLRRLTRPTLGG
jgi:CheY-like chemotaxis protein